MVLNLTCNWCKATSRYRSCLGSIKKHEQAVTARKTEREKRQRKGEGGTINGGQPPSPTSRPPGLMIENGVNWLICLSVGSFPRRCQPLFQSWHHEDYFKLLSFSCPRPVSLGENPLLLLSDRASHLRLPWLHTEASKHYYSYLQNISAETKSTLSENHCADCESAEHRTPAEDVLRHHLWVINRSRWASGLLFVITPLECCEISPADEDTAGTPVDIADPLFEGDGPRPPRADTCSPPGC